MTTALIDGDVVIHRASATAQSDVDWGDEEEGLTVNVPAAVTNAKAMVRNWMKMARCGSALVFLSPLDGSNFRKLLYTEYKANRRDKKKPEAFNAVYAALQEEFTTMVEPYLEADDLMGYYGSEDPKSRVIVSVDKDFQAVPCRLLLLGKDGKPKAPRPRLIPVSQANRFWLTQTLTGDAIDNYKGCPGIGEVKAAAAFESVSSMDDAWRVVVELFEAKGQSETEAVLNARLARILRFGEIDINNKRIKLWTPGNPNNWVSFDQIEPAASSASTAPKSSRGNRRSRRSSKGKARQS